ncbi:hypothetical protein PEL8287_03895 [Roseovarius litorisediminis]|uniref:DUF4440 domain-containing protein n=1 Tax=Roseovarius litorisediminis TaxID=1312363 RepID=A0A1Y5TTR2_9RHOB|nr:nuclear transport factor 2 family protein [Roseovarius litorisediminis]SLN69951.1 hypothetical protein PEL8287_03895 [Roseovarius litorisediminis]
MTDQDTEADLALKEILVCEHAVWRALVEGDAAADKNLLLPDFLGVYPTGFAGRDDHAGQLSGGPSVERYALTEARLLEVGKDHRLLCYRAEYLRIGETQSEAMYVSSLWQRTGAGWKNLFSQDTRVGGPLGV